MGADADRDAQLFLQEFARVQRAMWSGTRWRKAVVRRRTPGSLRAVSLARSPAADTMRSNEPAQPADGKP